MTPSKMRPRSSSLNSGTALLVESTVMLPLRPECAAAADHNERRNDDQTHAVARHRSPLFLFKAAAWSIRCHCDKTMQSGGNGERERRFIRDVAELSHHPARRLHTQSRMDRRLRICLDTEGWLYVATVLRCSTAVRNSCYGGVIQSLSCRPTLSATSIGERPCVVSSYFYLHSPCYRFFVRRRQLKCPICRKTCARGLPR